MILAFAAKGKKTIACFMLGLMYFEAVVPAYAVHAAGHGSYRAEKLLPAKLPPPAKPWRMVNGNSSNNAIGGPTQPENADFHSVNEDNMVNLFSGDFSYSIPLLDVGGYPLAIGYSSGVDMEQEASWVGLGWNINPGAISRSVRGLPDDFNGVDSITKTTTIKENKTIGVSGGIDLELAGKTPLSVGGSVGIFHNSYRGWGMETSLNASINVAASTAGALSSGLSLTSNSQEGFSISPSVSLSLASREVMDKNSLGGSMSLGLSYNSRSGMKALQYSAGLRWDKKQEKVQATTQLVTDALGQQSSVRGDDIVTVRQTSSRAVFGSSISFAYPTFTPGITMPYTSSMASVTVKLGTEAKVLHPNVFISGYVSKQTIADADKVFSLPAYGYLNYQNGAKNAGALLDYNREREVPYTETPAVNNIALPTYTYDIFSMTGEGTGGTFRAYRSDIGYVFDHHMRTRDGSSSYGVDLGFGDIVHAGVDVAFTRAYTDNGAWTQSNPLAANVAFTSSGKNYEAVYFRNPGEKAINTNEFYDAIGGDDVVRPKLYRAGPRSSVITTTDSLSRYKGGRTLGSLPMKPENATKHRRDKRTQVITYLTADEASRAGFDKYIENFTINRVPSQNCENDFITDMESDGIGLKAEVFADAKFKMKRYERNTPSFTLNSIQEIIGTPPPGVPPVGANNVSVRWTGRIKAPVSGVYTIKVNSDDGVRMEVNDREMFDDIDRNHPADQSPKNVQLNLEKGQFYKVLLEYRNGPAGGSLAMEWKCGSVVLSAKDMYWPDTAFIHDAIPGVLKKEERVNSFRKAHHISEIDVLNSNGMKYVYGLPVYNLKQKEVTFSVKHENGNETDGTASYVDSTDNSINNKNGNDWYYNSEETPAYAHSFLLTALVSPDYVDLTGDGVTDDDLGNGVRFNYTKTAGLDTPYTPYKWRTPYSRKASYNEGMRTDSRDDKGSFVYGEKELWYLNSVISKNMVAVFTLEGREDLAPINQEGVIDVAHNSAKRLKEINLYTKADFLKYNTNARPVKTVHFEYTYELCKGIDPDRPNTGKLTLKKIWFTYNGNNKGKKNAYVFNYSNNPAYNPRSSDRWGTYKSQLDNPGSTTNNLVTNAEFPYAIQDSMKAAANAGAWALDSIALPSGGRMKITYESDDYGFVQNRRAAQMMTVAGFSVIKPTALNSLTNELYGAAPGVNQFPKDFQYVGIHVPEPVTSNKDVFNKYLQGLETIYFRLRVQMPDDKWGKGYEFVTGYARPESGEYGMIDANTIWIKMAGIDQSGNAGGEFSTMAKTARQFLRLNLPSKAYPGSDVGDNLDLADGVKVLFSLADNVINTFRSFEKTAWIQNWARYTDLSRSYVRLNTPSYKKYGGGHRVKRIVIYDHWNRMTGQKESMYGSEYSYTVVKDVAGGKKEISSGVASYEPMLGGEENPFRVPLEYNTQVAPLAPTNLGYVELPMGESLFPGANVGYGCVRKRSIAAKKIRSATGFEETNFYTAYDFPTIVEYSVLDPESKMRYKPALGNLLKIKAAHYVVMSQGFKVELNDMHGKLRSHAVYNQTDPDNPISYTENFYHVDDQNATFKHLNNTILSMQENGVIDTASSIGKDMELMMDMREQRFVSNGTILNANGELFSFGLPPVLGALSFFAYPQHQETLYRSAAITKVITRQGIIDSVVVIDKGSRISTRNLLFNAETGDVILTATQNEFSDPVYSFTYPSGWMYDGMSGAYKNVSTILDKVFIKEGRITSGLGAATPETYFASGDEILTFSRNGIGTAECDTLLATFPSSGKIWAVDANALNGGAPSIFFMDKNGKPFTGNDITMKIVQSGRKNIHTSVGGVSMLANPLTRNTTTGKLELVIDENSKVINASMVEYKQNWQIEDVKKSKIICTY